MTAPSSSTPQTAPRSHFSPAFCRLFGHTILFLALFHLVFQLVVWLPLNWNRLDRDRDIIVYYDAAMRLKTGAPLYEPWPEYTPALVPNRFFYPPPFLLLARPLAELPFLWFCRVWYLLLLAAFWIYAATLGALATGGWNWRPTLIAALAVGLCPPTYIALGYGNFEPVMWACYGLAFSTRLRAAPLALAAMMKLHPIWALFLVIHHGGKRAFFPALTILLAGFGLGIWLCGVQNALGWWPATSPVISQGTFLRENWSLSFAVLRVLRIFGWNYSGGPLPNPARLYLSLTALLAPLSTLYFTRRKPLDLRLALTASATILFAPLCWHMYIPLLFAPATILYRERRGLPN